MNKVFVVTDECGAVRGVYCNASSMLETVTEMLEEYGWDEDECDGMTAAEYAEDRYGWFLSTNESKRRPVGHFDVDYFTVSICELE